MPQQQEKWEIGPPEQAVTHRAMISCADENAHVRVAGAETMDFHPPCAAASNEGENHSRCESTVGSPNNKKKAIPNQTPLAVCYNSSDGAVAGLAIRTP